MAAIKKEHGIVAILDALGASSYGDAEIAKFLDSRERVLTELAEWAEEEHGSIRQQQIVTFTFNDTIVVVHRCGEVAPTLKSVTDFSAILRKFIVDSMSLGLLFRGSAALGTFYVDENTNTVMGDAVTDAAQWYEQSEWMGIHFTPRSSIEINRMLEVASGDKHWAFLPYDVPLHEGKVLKTHAINWPKIFLVPKLRPWKDDNPPYAKLLRFLYMHKIPLGTEDKYFNTITFFKHSSDLEGNRKISNQRSA